MPFFDVIEIVKTVGLFGVWGIVFAESGLFFGFFFPGDSLLFVSGLLASQGFASIYLLVIGSCFFAILGETVGYFFGKKVGPAIFNKDDSFLFKKKYIEDTHIFFEKYGDKAVLFARFVPIVRTFVPIFAGVGGMNYKKFTIYNILGGCFWVLIMTLGGYFLGTVIPDAEKYIVYIVALIIFISFLPVIFEFLKKKKDIV